jgi:aminocarboxymuconate-semialdehyde decarboxylase
MMHQYSCTPGGEHKPVVARTRRAALTVDMHCHFTSQRADDLVLPTRKAENEPTLAAISGSTHQKWAAHIDSLDERVRGHERRLAEMDAMGIDVQVVSPGPMSYFYYTDPELGREASRLVNDDLAAMIANEPARLYAMGTVPLQQTELAVAEAERCVRDLGFRGIEVSTHVNGEELSIPRLAPFFAKMEDLGVPLFIHPLGFTDGRRLQKHYFINAIGNPIESTIAVAHLIFDGVLDDFPSLKICVAHGGGYIAHYIGRLDHIANPEYAERELKHMPSDYMRRLYFDTVVHDPTEIEHLVKRWGVDRVLLGSDWPYRMGEDDPVGLLERCAFDHDTFAAVAGRNAAELFGLPVDAPA